MKKARLFTILLALVLCVGLLTVSASAAETVASGTCGDSVSWMLDDTGTLTISGDGAMTNFEDYSSTPWTSYRYQITDIVIEDGVTAIGDNAFCEFSRLSDIAIPNSVSYIGTQAFYYCSNLSKMTLPAGISQIYSRTFMNCRNLVSVVIQEGVTTIDSSAFEDCVSLEQITIPASLSYIGTDAFMNCKALSEVHVSDLEAWDAITFANVYANPLLYGSLYHNGEETVITMASGACGDLASWTLYSNGAFSISGTGAMTDYADSNSVPWCDYDSKIVHAEIEAGITSIGDYAFIGCNYLKDVIIPESVVRIGKSAFSGCDSLSEVHITDLEAWNNIAFANDSSTPLLYADLYVNGVQTILQLAQGICGDHVTWTRLSDGRLVISGQGPMYDYTNFFEDNIVRPSWEGEGFDTGISHIVIEDGVTRIGSCAFYWLGERWLERVTIAGSVEVIGESAFYGCTDDEGTGWTELVIPEGVTTIGDYAFAQCRKLKTIVFPSTLRTVGKSAFYWGYAEKVHVPDMETWCSISFDTFFANPFQDSGAQLYVAGEPVTDIVIPYGVEKIGAAQFSGMTFMTSIQIPDSVTVVEREAFYMLPNGRGPSSKLTEIVFPASVENIGVAALGFCEHLEKIVVLNPACTFDGDLIEKWGYSVGEEDEWTSSPTVLYGFAGSTAESYAAENNHDFVVLTEYPVTEGADSTVVLTAPADLTIRASGQLADFEGVAVDGLLVDPACYTVAEGSTVVTFDADYLVSLSEGTHSVVFYFTDGVASTSFVIRTEPAIDAPVVTASNVASSGKIKLTWDKVDGAAKYKVYRSTSKTGAYSLMKTTTSTSYTNTSAKAGTQYYYYVVAVDANGAVSAPSTVVTRTCDVAQPVAKAANVASSGKIKVTWDKVDGAVKYEVYRSTTGKTGSWSLMKTTTSTSYTNTSAKAGTQYYYKVRALASKSAANSAYSAAVSRTCDLAQPVITLSNVASSGKIKVTWKAVDGAVEYKVYRSTTGKDGSWSLMKTTTGTSFTNTSAKAGTQYYYKVIAIHSKSAANSAYSAAKYRTCDLARPVVTIALKSGKPRLTWDAVEGASGYKIYRATSSGGTYSLMKTTTATSYTNTGAVAGTTYYYKVIATHTKSAANSAYSLVKSITAK